MQAPRPGIFIDAGVLADFFGEDVLAPVQVAVLLLVVRGAVHVRLELDVVGGGTLLEDVFDGLAGLFDLLDAWADCLCRLVAVQASVEVGSGFVLH